MLRPLNFALHFIQTFEMKSVSSYCNERMRSSVTSKCEFTGFPLTFDDVWHMSMFVQIFTVSWNV